MMEWRNDNKWGGGVLGIIERLEEMLKYKWERAWNSGIARRNTKI